MSNYKALPVTETTDYLLKRALINKEINENKVNIDREVFKKSLSDKELLKEAKKNYLLNKGTNNFDQERVKILETIIKNPLICGNLILTVKQY